MRTAGRVLRHTEILRGVAHELSNAPDREDRPASGAEAKARFDTYLEQLSTNTPRAGLAAPTGAFIDSLIERAGRYGAHLFVCFDDPRIPATTNALEGFFGASKATLRSALGAGSTTNTVVSNLGADVLVAYQYLRRPDALAGVRVPSATPAAFSATRTKLDRDEAPGVRRRSLVRFFKQHVERLRNTWGRPPPDANAWLGPDLIPLVRLEVHDPDADLALLQVRPIAPEERLGWRLYMDRYHYLGDRPVVGEHVLYAAFLGGELVALLGWASAAFRAPLREAYVGWDEATKRRRLHLVANNIRFLILPWVRVRHLASKILALNLRRLSPDWQRVWKHPILLCETFVDSTRFRGTSYRAANWLYLGETAGRSKHGNNYAHGGTKKALLVYPLRRHATQCLREGT